MRYSWFVTPYSETDRFRGAMIGVAIGDAIGELAFGISSVGQLQALAASVTTLRYTDDTAMTIALAESIVESGSIDAEEAGRSYHCHYEREPSRGYAGGPPQVFHQVDRDHCSYLEAAGQLYLGAGSYGNGAAMRAAPVGLAYCFESEETIYSAARESALATHTHEIGIDGAAMIASAVALAVNQQTPSPAWAEDLISMAMRTAKSEKMRSQVDVMKAMIESKTKVALVGLRIGMDVSAQNSVPFALYSAAVNPGSFEDCLYCAALNSGDRDTVACMACGIVGGLLGFDSIPSHWVDKLENAEVLIGLADRLLTIAVGRTD